MKFRVFLLILVCLGLPWWDVTANQVDTAKPKNIILLIGDGMGPAHIAALRMFKDNPETPELEPLLLDNHLVGSLSTEPYRPTGVGIYPVTDSAASATALSSGHKSYNGAVAVDASGKPVLTVLELAKRAGKKVGLVATSQIVHATPAAFIAHHESRRDYDLIANQFLDNRWQGRPLLDLFLGGGWRYFDRKDRNLIQELAAEGYQIIRTAAELESASMPLAGLFAEVAIPARLDRTEKHPSLAQMTEAALTRLDNARGFFLMVEGSQIDWASHDNDVAGMLNELDDFYQAVEVAFRFAEKKQDTLVLVTADHETGGFSIGHSYRNENQYRFNPEPIKNLRHSIDHYAQQITQQRALTPFVSDLGVALNEAELEQWQALLEAPRMESKAVKQLLKSIIDRVSYSGWTTGGHTGVDVNIYAYGPGANRFIGHHSNTHVGQTLLNWVTEGRSDKGDSQPQ